MTGRRRWLSRRDWARRARRARTPPWRWHGHFSAKGANFTASIAFQVASTNLVIELGIILALLMGWKFTLGEFIGGPIMIVLLAVTFRWWVHGAIVDGARQQADKGVAGSMEGHAAMDMSVRDNGSIWQRLRSPAGFTATSQYFVMDWAALYRDILAGVLIAAAISAWVPEPSWHAFFFAGHPVLAALWGPIVGPLVAVISFVCSVGNVPLAAVLWSAGISFLSGDDRRLPRPEPQGGKGKDAHGDRQPGHLYSRGAGRAAPTRPHPVQTSR